MDLFTGGLAVLVCLCAVLHYYTRSTAAVVKDANFSRFQQIYLIVYMLAMCKSLVANTFTLF